MIAEFTRRRGYDLRPWLPVLTGRVVESAEASDRFLWDFRRTIADLTAENHYDQLTSCCMRAAWAATANRTNRAARLSPTAWR